MPHTRAYRELLEKTAHYAKMGSWEVDLINHTIYWSDVTKLIHGVPLNFECNLNEAINFFKDPVSRKKITESFENAVKYDQEYDLKLLLTTAKNKEIWVRAIGMPVFENGTCVKVYGLFQDIDVEERQHSELNKQLQFTNNVFLNSSIGIVIYDKNTNIFKVNEGFCEMLGYTSSEMNKMTFRDFIHPDDLEESLIGLQKLKKGKIKSFTKEKRYKHKNGKTIYIHLVLTVIRDKDQNPIQYLGQVIDLTKEHESKEKLKSYLNVTKDQNQRLLNFAHIVSHNLRSHSGNLKMLLDLMNMQYKDQLKENEIMPLFDQAIEGLGETIQNLNEVVLVHTSDKKKFKKLNLIKYLDASLESISAIIKDEKVVIEKPHEKQVDILAIPAYLESILLNLLTNAIKYRSPDRQSHIAISLENSGRFISLAVKDNGLGIDLVKHKEKLFGMYKTFHDHSDSRGIGLFITKNQIEAMGGFIEVESEVNKGSLFKVYFKNGK
ncbi:sensor histidine kinase [Mesonia maritima]|uniref:histidine kinase n=1 Tax=Mesonia maritima TaxID=1793873 RepID=A0ABU1K866_9FLAO|nr:PAS domain S-box protein [Mesonia maritima]MDR6301450.1 PAS domain S-box-containing protein [Mesonia maritima]